MEKSLQSLLRSNDIFLLLCVSAACQHPVYKRICICFFLSNYSHILSAHTFFRSRWPAFFSLLLFLVCVALLCLAWQWKKKTFQCTYVQNYSCFGVQGYRSLYVPSYLHHCGTVYKNKKLLRSNNKNYNNNIKIKNAIHEQMKFN